MDDLYGDLPDLVIDRSSKFFEGELPTISLENQHNKPISKLKSNDSKIPSNAGHDIIEKTPQVIEKPKGPLPNKFVPNSLLFKPRQTSSTVKTKELLPGTSITVLKPRAEQEERVKSEKIPELPPSDPIEEFNSVATFEVSDSYDPRRPNDYLQFCEEREEQKRVNYMAEENRRQMEEMERHRLELEKQRKELTEKRDYQKLLELSTQEASSSSGVGRGRGRGIVNLPAWMIQQINDSKSNDTPSNNDTDRDSKRLEDPPNSDLTSANKRRKINSISKPSKILLLKNMAIKSELDSELSDEIKSECQKYGPVVSCQIFQVSPTHEYYREDEEIRIFVAFEKQESAIRALRYYNFL
jgi:hypothetical protein